MTITEDFSPRSASFKMSDDPLRLTMTCISTPHSPWVFCQLDPSLEDKHPATCGLYTLLLIPAAPGFHKCVVRCVLLLAVLTCLLQFCCDIELNALVIPFPSLTALRPRHPDVEPWASMSCLAHPHMSLEESGTGSPLTSTLSTVHRPFAPIV